MIRRIEDRPGYDDLNAAYQAAGFTNYGDEARVVLLQGAIATHGNRVTSASAIRSLRNHALRLVRPKRGG